MKVIIAGSRTIDSYDQVTLAIHKSGWGNKITEIVSGKAPGADYFGIVYAGVRGIPVKEFPADWDTYAKAAGPIRNQQMAEYADALILVWDGKSKGSADMLRKAKVQGLRIYEHVVGAK